MIENNKVILFGTVTEDFKYSHQFRGIDFYKSKIFIKGKNGEFDFVPLVVPGNILDTTKKWENSSVYVKGSFRSHNIVGDDGAKVILNVLAEEIANIDFAQMNYICLTGYVCKEPSLKKCRNGKQYLNILLAVHRKYGNSDYLPCVIEKEKFRCKDLKVGDKLRINGKIQSRMYKKKISESEYETRTAYEVSISQMEVIESEECKDQVADTE